MQILIDNKSGAPIYDQIYTQIKNHIIGGICGVTAFFGVRTNGELTAYTGSTVALLITLLLPMAACALSWLASIRFYEKREVR